MSEILSIKHVKAAQKQLESRAQLLGGLQTAGSCCLGACLLLLSPVLALVIVLVSVSSSVAHFARTELGLFR